MSELILIRHGESLYNIKITDYLDSKLTKFGEQQAKETGIYLKNNFPDISKFSGITSPYRRCLQTSEIIQNETGISFTVNSGPREVMINYEVVYIKNYKKIFPNFIWKYDHGLSYRKETEQQFIERMELFYRELIDDKTVVVSHGTPINTLYELAIGKPSRANITNYVRNCSISYVKDRNGIYLGKSIMDKRFI